MLNMVVLNAIMRRGILTTMKKYCLNLQLYFHIKLPILPVGEDRIFHIFGFHMLVRAIRSVRPSFVSVRATTSAASSSFEEQDKLLRADVKKLGKILGEAIKADNPAVFESVEALRRYGKEVRICCVAILWM